MAKIQVRDWRVIDIYFNDADEKKALKEVARYEAKGYVVQQYDTGGPNHDNCVQLMTYTKIINK